MHEMEMTQGGKGCKFLEPKKEESVSVSVVGAHATEN